MNKPGEPLLHSTDRAVIDAAVSGSGVVVTPELLAEIKRDLDARVADVRERYPQLVAACDYETRLAVAAWVFRAIVDHATEGGSFRYLIYNRLGFSPDAYTPLYLAGGMTISNEFTLPDSPPEKTE